MASCRGLPESIAVFQRVEEFYKRKLDQLENRAHHAEITFLTTKFDGYMKSMDENTKQVEAEFERKLVLYQYSELEPQIRQAFQQKVNEINQSKKNAKDILEFRKYCIKQGLDLKSVLQLDDNKTLEEIKYQGNFLIQQVLKEKEEAEKELSLLKSKSLSICLDEDSPKNSVNTHAYEEKDLQTSILTNLPIGAHIHQRNEVEVKPASDPAASMANFYQPVINKPSYKQQPNNPVSMAQSALESKNLPVQDTNGHVNSKETPSIPVVVQSKPSTQSITKQNNSGYKTRICRNWEQKKCTYGKYCMFAHGKGELVEQATSNTSSTTSPRSIANNEAPNQAQGSTHSEPCGDQFCLFYLNFLLYKTKYCNKNEDGKCAAGSDCRFAHSRKELQPMPKWDLCERHKANRCFHVNDPTKCVYAHSLEELREKPVGIEKKEKESKTALSNNFKNADFAIKFEKKQQVMPDECSICMDPLLERKDLLSCGHNYFHATCLAQWVSQHSPSCPVCRIPVKLSMILLQI